MSEKRLLKISDEMLGTVKPSVLPFNNSVVTVESWHSIGKQMKELFPNDEWVGHIDEFGLDIPESELIELSNFKGDNNV